MAARLQYSFAAFRMAIRMGRGRVVVIVEGVDDIYFYEKVVRGCVGGGDYSAVVIRTPDEVAGVGSGKAAVLKLYREIGPGNRDQPDRRGRKCLFFVDLDYDFLSRKRVRDLSVIYTPAVCVENLVYEFADLRASVEVIVGRSLPSPMAFDDFRGWTRACVKAWFEWAVFCVACELAGASSRQNRSKKSAFHVGCPIALVQEKWEEGRRQFELDVGCSKRADKLIRRATRICALLTDRAPELIFSGKWYPDFLRMQIRMLGPPYSAAAGRLEDRVLRTHALRSEPSGRWLRYYKDRIERALGGKR